jgi:hypothetical protein
MKADVKLSANREKEALQWAIAYFRDRADRLKPYHNPSVDFFIAQDLWRDDPKKLDDYIRYRAFSAGGYAWRINRLDQAANHPQTTAGHRIRAQTLAGRIRQRFGKPGWDPVSSIRGLCKFAAVLMNEGEPLPESLRLFIMMFLLEPNWFLKKVGAKGRKYGHLKLRDLFIGGAIEDIVEKWKFPATRNEATERPSAASIVRDALKRGAGIHLTEKAVNTIWGEVRWIHDDYDAWLKGRRPKE